METLKDSNIHIKFDKASPIAVREPLVNSYGFDLTDENYIGCTKGAFKFTIIGFHATKQYDMLLATIKIAFKNHVKDEYTYVQKFDLYNPDKIDSYCRTASASLKTTVSDIKTALCSLRESLEKFRNDESKKIGTTVKKVFITDKERKDALFQLESDNVLDSLKDLFKQAGVVIEMDKALQLFFILLSRHLDKPLHVVFQGSRQLSKSLMDIVTSTVSSDQIHELTSMSTSALYYTKGKDFWKNKVLYLKSISNQFKAVDTINEFIENGFLKRNSTENDYQTNMLYSSDKDVQGAISLLTFCNIESINRKFSEECFFIRVEEDEINQKTILEHIKMESAGLIDIQQKEDAIRMLRNIQHLIKPIKVVIPFSRELELPANLKAQLITLPQFLTFIKAVTLLHQKILPKRIDTKGLEYIESTKEHLEIALGLFKSIIINKGDNLRQGQRVFLERMKNYVKGEEVNPSEYKNKIFKAQELMKAFNMCSSSFYREFNILKERGYVQQIAGNKKEGIAYKIMLWDDLIQLESQADEWNIKLNNINCDVSQKFPKSFPKIKPYIKPIVPSISRSFPVSHLNQKK